MLIREWIIANSWSHRLSNKVCGSVCGSHSRNTCLPVQNMLSRYPGTRTKKQYSAWLHRSTCAFFVHCRSLCRELAVLSVRHFHPAIGTYSCNGHWLQLGPWKWASFIEHIKVHLTVINKLQGKPLGRLETWALFFLEIAAQCGNQEVDFTIQRNWVLWCSKTGVKGKKIVLLIATIPICSFQSGGSYLRFTWEIYLKLRKAFS